MASLDKHFGQRLFGGLLESGAFGVDLFFVISGFIIAIVSLEGAKLTPTISLRDFLVRRFIRIVPLMWIAIISFAAFRLGARGVWMGGDYLRAFLLLPWGDVQPSHIWTLRHEMIFYLVFAASFLFLAGRLRWLLMALWIFGAVAVPLLLALVSPTARTQIPDAVQIVFSGVNFEFCAGLLLAAFWLRRAREFRIRTPIDPWLVLLFLCGIAFYVIIPMVAIGRGWTVALPFLLFLPIVLLAIHLQSQPGFLRTMGTKLGDASYSIYLFHPAMVSALLALWAWLGHGTPIWIVVPACAVISVAACVVIHQLLERPLIAALRHRFGPRAQTSEASLSAG